MGLTKERYRVGLVERRHRSATILRLYGRLGRSLLDRDHNVCGCADGPTEIEYVQPAEVTSGERVRLPLHFPMQERRPSCRSHAAFEFLARIRFGHGGLEI